MTLSWARRIVDGLLMFLSALLGRGGGSSWDGKGQTAAFARHIDARPGMVVLDVGANNGKWLRSLHSHLATNRPEYHIFECAPYCFEHLERNTRDIDNLTFNKTAVSDGVGRLTLFLSESGSGLASLHARGDTSVHQHEYRELEVDTIDLDSYAEAKSLQTIDVLKIDVEGHELAVLNGAERLFSSKSVNVALFEFGSANVNSRTFFRDFWEYFGKHRYDIHQVIPGGRTYPINAYRDELEYFRGASNFIVVRRP